MKVLNSKIEEANKLTEKYVQKLKFVKEVFESEDNENLESIQRIGKEMIEK